MDHAEKVLDVIFIARDQPPEPLQPGKQPFDTPTPLVSSELAPVLGLTAVLPVRRDQVAVWRAWFANDTPQLAELLPPELIAIDTSEKWRTREDELSGAKDFAAKGGKLVRLEFPQTEIQVYGHTAILDTKFTLETEMNGKQTTLSGRATEMFVSRHGNWVNVGWHLDTGRLIPYCTCENLNRGKLNV